MNEQKLNEILKARQILTALRDPYKETVDNFEIDKALLSLQALSIYFTKES